MRKIAREKGNLNLFYWALTWGIFGVFIMITGMIIDSMPSTIIGIVCILINGFVLTQTNDIKSIVHLGTQDYQIVEIGNDKYYMVIVKDLVPKCIVVGNFFSDGAITNLKKNEELTITCKYIVRYKEPNYITMTMGVEEVNTKTIKVHDPYIKD